RSGRKVAVWHNYRRCPAASLARRIVERGDIGAIRQVRAVYLQDWLADAEAPWSWRNDRSVCGSGAHGDLNAHLIDMTRFLTGLEFDEVVSLRETFTKERPDAANKAKKITDRKSTRLNSSHVKISYAVFCLKKKKKQKNKPQLE